MDAGLGSGAVAPGGEHQRSDAGVVGAASVDRIPADVSAEDAEMWCKRCGKRHGVVWFAPNDLWNAVMRGGVKGNPDEFGFCCPLCFMQLAEERLGPLIFKVSQEVFDAA